MNVGLWLLILFNNDSLVHKHCLNVWAGVLTWQVSCNPGVGSHPDELGGSFLVKMLGHDSLDNFHITQMI